MYTEFLIQTVWRYKNGQLNLEEAMRLMQTQTNLDDETMKIFFSGLLRENATVLNIPTDR